MAGEYLIDPAAGAGCPIGDTGWTIILDAFYNGAVGSRVYGSDLYGSGVYGDAGGAPVSAWVDLTDSVTGTVVTRGTRTGAQRQPVDRIEFDVIDEDGSLWDINPAAVYAIRAGVPVRAGLRDPSGVYWPLATGRIERIEDDHDEPPRVLGVDSTGMLGDLVVDRIDISRPSETAGARATYYLNLAPWTWSPVPPASSIPSAYVLAADPGEDTREIRGTVDLIGRSVGLYQGTTKRGAWYAAQWPILAAPGPAIQITDCRETTEPFSDEFSDAFGDPGQLQGAKIRYVEDRAALLNLVQMASKDPPAASYTLQNDLSIALHGVVSNTYGFPWSDLMYTNPANIAPIAQRIINRFGNITYRLESVSFDSLQDPRWIGYTALLDYGTPVVVNREEVAPMTMDAIVVGYVLRLDRDRIRGTVYLQQITPGAHR